MMITMMTTAIMMAPPMTQTSITINVVSVQHVYQSMLCAQLNHTKTRLSSTQPCIPPGSLNRVPALAGVKAGMSPLPGGR